MRSPLTSPALLSAALPSTSSTVARSYSGRLRLATRLAVLALIALGLLFLPPLLSLLAAWLPGRPR